MPPWWRRSPSFLLWFFAGRRYGLVSAVFATFFVLPRLVSGAHWFTDAIIGGVVTALVVVPLVVYTPVQDILTRGLVSGMHRLKGRSGAESGHPSHGLRRHD